MASKQKNNHPSGKFRTGKHKIFKVKIDFSWKNIVLYSFLLFFALFVLTGFVQSVEEKKTVPVSQLIKDMQDGKVKQKIVASLGVIANDSDKERLVMLAHALIAKLGQDRTGQLELDIPGSSGSPPSVAKSKTSKWVDPKDLVHVRTTPCGASDVYGALSRQVGFDALFESIDAGHRHAFEVKKIIPMLIQ